MSETVFSRIIDGEIPCHRVYEDEHVLAFLDIGPLSRGHTLVIPKERQAYLHDLSAEAGAALGRVLPAIARAVKEATECPAYNILQNNGSESGQAVFHVHFHIIPRYDTTGLKFQWTPGELDDDTAQDLITRITRALPADLTG